MTTCNVAGLISVHLKCFKKLRQSSWLTVAIVTVHRSSIAEHTGIRSNTIAEHSSTVSPDVVHTIQ
ncbi:hypothetical protein BgiBS90_022215, partial [Biomphalaria glabrata]